MLAHETHNLLSGIKKARLKSGEVNQPGGEVSLTNTWDNTMSKLGKKSSVYHKDTYNHNQIKRSVLGTLLKKQESSGHTEYFITREDSFNHDEEK
jgi:hypothetical protein